MTTTKMKKDRGLDATVPQGQSDSELDSMRFLNKGAIITLSDGKDYRVRDIPFDAWITGLVDLIPVLLAFSDSGVNDMQILVGVGKDPQVRKSLYYLMSQAVPELDEADIPNLSLSDSVKIVAALKKVVNFSEIKELFTQAGLGLSIRPTTGETSPAPPKR